MLLFAPFGALFGLATIAFIARRVDGAVAFAGIILGPLLLIIVPVGISSTIARAAGY